MTKITSINDTTTLNNGVKMPWFGLGVWKVEDGDEVIQAVKTALANGYRSIDTAEIYGNEVGVGQAIKESGVPREEIFITTKVANPRQEQGYDEILKAFDESLQRLGVEYIDLYLVHWPLLDKYVDAWKALVHLYGEGRVRAIGVSNFYINHLKRIIEETGHVPAVNQVELHPLLTRQKLRDFCKEHNIQIEAYSPLMQGNLNIPLLQELAEKYGKTPAQIVLRWNLEHKIVTIPKSVREHRIIENANIFDFELSAEDIQKIDALNEDFRYLSGPPNYVVAPMEDE